jgi:hypothetical protein
MADNEAVQRRCGNHVVVRVIRQSSSTLARSLAPSLPPSPLPACQGWIIYVSAHRITCKTTGEKKKDSASPSDLPELGMMALGSPRPPPPTITTTTTIVQASRS